MNEIFNFILFLFAIDLIFELSLAFWSGPTNWKSQEKTEAQKEDDRLIAELEKDFKKKGLFGWEKSE